MGTVILRLAGPLMAFGETGRFALRDSAPTPSKSSVIGLVRCALGHDRHQPLGPLADTLMGVRADRAGQPVSDFQTLTSPMVTAGEQDPWKIARSEATTRLTVRHYLADAAFTIALQHDDDDVLQRIDDAFTNPLFLPYIGRKSCPVSLPPRPPEGGLRNLDLRDALYHEPLLDRPDRDILLELEVPADTAWDPQPGPMAIRSDQPTNQSLTDRGHQARTVIQITEPSTAFPILVPA